MNAGLTLGLGAMGLLAIGAAIVGERAVSREARKDRITVVYWEKWTGAEGQAMQETVSAFNASQDRIFVKYLSISGVDQKTMLATAGGNPPDVAGIWENQVFQFADAGALTDLTPLADATGVRREQYIPVYWDELSQPRPGGTARLWALPSTPASLALYVRPDLVPPEFRTPETFPKDLKGLDDLSDRITRKTKTGGLALAGFLPSNPGWWNWSWGPLFGGTLMKNGRPTVDTPEARAAFRWIKGYTDRYGSGSIQTFQSGFGAFASPQDPFMEGKVATELNGPWKGEYIELYKKGLNWFAVPFPYPEGRPDLADHAVVGQDVLTIPRGAKHPREAFEFIRYVQRQDVMERLCKAHGKNSPLAWVSEAFFRTHPNRAIRLFDALARRPQAIPIPKTGFHPQLSNEIGNAFSEVTAGTKTPEQALADAQRRVDGLWDVYRTQILRETATPARVAAR